MAYSASQTDLVALRYPNRRLGAQILQAWEHGLAVLPVDHSLPSRTVAGLLERFRAARLEDETGTTELPGAQPIDADVAAVVLTSGSSGPPKGVELTHRALKWSAAASIRRLGVGADLHWLCCVPVGHVAGLAILVRSLVGGTTPVIHDRFDPDAVRAETSTRLISLVPTQLRRLLDAGVDLSGYAAVLLGGGPAPSALLTQAAAAGIQVVKTYGMTETCGGCVYNGEPLEGVGLRLDGEIIELSGPMLMSRYRRDPALSRQVLQDGWFTTADRGRLVNGKLQVLGRVDDVIITGGRKVSAGTVEHHLLDLPDILDAAVVGLDDPEWGQIVAALVVTKSDGDIEQLREALRPRIAAHELPKRILRTDSIPRTRSGKSDRPAIQLLFTTDAK